MNRAEERSQIRRGLAGVKTDVNRFMETVQQSIAQAEKRLDELDAEEAAERADEKPTTFEERVGGVPDDDTPWKVSDDGDSVLACTSYDIGDFTSGRDARFVSNLVNNWELIVAVLREARPVAFDDECINYESLQKALDALDAAEVIR